MTKRIKRCKPEQVEIKRRKPAASLRDESLFVRLRKSEQIEIERRAAAAGLCVAEYVRMTLLG